MPARNTLTTLVQSEEKMAQHKSARCQKSLTPIQPRRAGSSRCFVIMPFSTIPKVGTKCEWTRFFEEYIKPAVESAGFGYTCTRSAPVIGNLLAGIMRDLEEADVVIADLSGKNANVFYELGVRHALRGRTILLAQQHSDIPFDLRSYAYHIYDWKSAKGRRAFFENIARLLKKYDIPSTLPDNPVDDFMRSDSNKPLLVHPSRFPTDAQRDTANEYLQLYAAHLQSIERGQIPLSGGHGGYFTRFMNIIERNTTCEEVRVFASLRPLEAPGGIQKFHRAELFRRLKAAVAANKVSIEYIIFVTDESVTERPEISALLGEYWEFASGVRLAFGDKVQVVPTDTERTIALLCNHKCAFTHTWSAVADVISPMQWIRPEDYKRLAAIYEHIRLQSRPWNPESSR